MKIRKNLWAGYDDYYVVIGGNWRIKKTLRLNNCLGKWELAFGSMYTNDIKDEEHEPVVGNVDLKKLIKDAMLKAVGRVEEST